MSEIAHLAATIFKRAGKANRFIVAIAGPPGARQIDTVGKPA
ncbi:hypothetical protein ACVWWD_001872 [Mesorhizobium sp. URHB0026]